MKTVKKLTMCLIIVFVVSMGVLLSSYYEQSSNSGLIIFSSKVIDSGGINSRNFDNLSESDFADFLNNINLTEFLKRQRYKNIPGPVDIGNIYPYNTGHQNVSPSVGSSWGGRVCYAAESHIGKGSYNTIGFSVGGAKDINNFRENINYGYLPLFTDITYEGLFYDYFFSTGEKEPCDELFCPSYSYAVSIDPLTGEKEYYLSVGLNSGIKESDFARKKLNLVIVLDISGSMSSRFNRYYYNSVEFTEKPEDTEDWNKTKIDVARESIVALLNHLNGDDRFGLVLFNNNAKIRELLGLISDKNMEELTSDILSITANGGTNLNAGMSKATEMLEEYQDVDPTEYENRIIYLTDAMPNIGDISQEGLLGKMKKNSEKHVYTSFIGIGVDFNSELVEYITKTRGANYYSVHRASEFKNRMDDEFEYMVTPLVFNLTLKLESDSFEIQKVYGSPEANMSTGELMKVNTLFPSKKTDGETKGGLVLLKLKKISNSTSMKLSVSYEDRTGKTDSNDEIFELPDTPPDFFGNNGIRKGILLSRYATLLMKWVVFERNISSDPYLSTWERKSLTLKVSDEFQEIFSAFKEYFAKEMIDIGDETLQQEYNLLHNLSIYNPTIINANIDDNDSTITMQKGELLNVTLLSPSNANHDWIINTLDQDVLTLTESFHWGQTDEIGDTGKDTWVFKAVEKGNTTLSILCGSPWDSIENLVDSFTLHLEVK